MYMKQYTLSEFRKNTREAFNLAESLEDVVVERYGLRYRLVRAADLPNNTVSSSSGLYPKVAEKALGRLEPKPLEVKRCPHGKKYGVCANAGCLTIYRMGAF